MILGAIDIGTNSVRLLVAAYADGRFRTLYRDLVTTCLGAGLITTGFLSPRGRESTLETVVRFAALAQRLGSEKTTVFGTSAMREAADGAEFSRLLAEKTGVPVEILSSETEAARGYSGVVNSLPELSRALVFDLGGGSCELTWQSGDTLITHSVKVGAVYLTEKFLYHDPPAAGEVASARECLYACFSHVGLPSAQLVGVGGTVTSLAAMAMEMVEYDPARVHGYRLGREKVRLLLQDMLARTCPERQKLPGVQKERAAILPAGTLVVDTLMEASGASEVLVSEGDILLGSLYALLADQH